MSAVEVRLRRPNSDTAWGFRLQGGQDANAPLTVQRVFNGSPADGNLQRGDVLLSINGSDVSAVYLKKAEELVKASTNSLSMFVRRTGIPVNSSQPHIDLPKQQQPIYRNADSSPSLSQQPGQQVPSSFGSSLAHQSHHQQSSRSPSQSNVWRPPTQSSESYSDHHSTSAGEVYHSVKSQWPTGSNTPHQPAGDSTGTYGHHQWSDGAASVESRSGPGGHPHHQTGQGRAASEHDDHLFPPFSGSSNATVPAAQRGFGTTQNYGKHQAPISPQSANHGLHSSVEPPRDQQQQPAAAEDDDAYEVKSVRDIKQMFNQLAKPSSSGPKKSSPAAKPTHVWQKPSAPEHINLSTNNSTKWNAAPSVLSPSTKPVSQSSPTAARSFASPPKASPSSSSYYDDLYGSYPPPRQNSGANSQPVLTKAVTPQPKPGAGYSYQGIVSVTPAKTVHGKGKTPGGGGGSGQANKKKEFDPSQSLVFQALQEENERAKRGEVASPEEEAPRARPQPTGARGSGQRNAGPDSGAQQSQQQRSARLQELLERDQAQAQQVEDQKYGATQPGSSPQMTAQARREMSPSYPRPQQQQQRQQQWQQPQQHQQHHRPGPSAQPDQYHQQQHQSAAAGFHQQSHQPQQQYQQQAQPVQQNQYQQFSAPSAYGYQQQPYGNSYHGGYSPYGDANNHEIPISDF